MRLFSRRFRMGLAVYAAIAALAEGGLLMLPWLFGLFIDGLNARQPVSALFAGMVCVAFAAWLLGTLDAFWLVWLVSVGKRDWRGRLLNAWGQQEPDEARRWPQGAAGMKFLRDVPAFGEGLLGVFPALCRGIFSCAFSCVFALWHDWRLGLVFLGLIPFSLMVHGVFQRRFSTWNGLQRVLQDKLCSRVFEFLHVYPDLKAMGAERPFLENVRGALQKISDTEYHAGQELQRYQAGMGMVLLAGEYLTVGVAGYFAFHGQLKIGEIVFYQILVMRVLHSCTAILQCLPQLSAMRESRHSMEELVMREKEKVQEPRPALNGKICRVEMRSVHFAYQGDSREILNGYSLAVDHGEILSLRGVNGVGKTTLWRLLTGDCRPTAGEVLVNGIPLSCLDLQDYRSRMAFVTQQPFLLYGTLRKNIILSDDAPVPENLDYALEWSGFGECLRRFPEGLDRRLEEGAGLSGGEIQRLALARALYRRPEVLVLDEVTNHLDTEGKAQILRLLPELRGKSLVIVVSHDGEIRSLCDREVLLK